MTKPPPESRVPFGQQIEDRLDAVAESMRRDTAKWIERQQRAAPGDAGVHGSMLGGIATAILDELNKSAGGDPAQIRAAWDSFADGYLQAQADDAADAQAQPAEPTP